MLGFGRHIWTLPPDDVIQSIKFNYLATPFQIMAYSVPKLSVAIFIDRILSPSRIRRYILYGVPCVQLLSGIISIILLFKTCTPVASIWDPAVKQQYCLPHDPTLGYNYYVAGKSNTHVKLCDAGTNEIAAQIQLLPPSRTSSWRWCPLCRS